MSVAERFFVSESENSPVREKPKAVKTAKDSFGSAARKKLGDISNLPHLPKSLVQDEKGEFVSNTTKEFIEQLQKENTALVNLLSDRNKLIESSGFELQKLRINLQKVQQQNFELVQANSQMLVELNFGKDRLKVLHHELGCRNGLLKARELELEVSLARSSKSEEAGKSSEADRADIEGRNTRKQQQSEGGIVSTVQQTQLNQKTENKRVSLRRQSARFNFEKPDPTEDKFEVGSSTRDKAGESSEPVLQKSNSLDSCSVKQAQLKENSENKSLVSTLRVKGARSDPRDPEWEAAKELQRTSIGRPLRLAVKKVQSYKEIPVNVKMRRRTE